MTYKIQSATSDDQRIDGLGFPLRFIHSGLCFGGLLMPFRFYEIRFESSSLTSV
jgi:hypothetical protein